MGRSSGFGEGHRTGNCMYGRDNGEELRVWGGHRTRNCKYERECGNCREELAIHGLGEGHRTGNCMCKRECRNCKGRSLSQVAGLGLFCCL
jgi:hypothetical protein